MIVGDDVPWDQVRAVVRRGALRPDDPSVPRFSAVMPMASAQRLIAGAGGDMNRLLNEQPGSSFRAVTLPGRASIDATTAVSRIETNNVIGRLRGSGTTGESVLLLAHWDHLGLCRPEGAPDRICNGAVDNASGVAALIEIAGQLSARRAAGPRHPVPGDHGRGSRAGRRRLLRGPSDRPARRRSSPRSTWTRSRSPPRATPVAIMPSNVPELNALVASTVTASGRTLDPDDEAATLVQRQDGWALARHGVPALMIGGSFSNMTLLGHFLEAGRYHAPDDQADSQLVLDGAAEDTNLTATIVRRLADPAQYQRPRPPAAPRPAQ